MGNLKKDELTRNRDTCVKGSTIYSLVLRSFGVLSCPVDARSLGRMYNRVAEFRCDVTFTVGPRFDGAPKAKELGWIV